MASPHHKHLSKGFGNKSLRWAQAAAILALSAFVVIIAVEKSRPFISPEVAFTDAAPSGLAIVPASCASVPPATTGDANGVGYVVPTGVSQAEIVNPPGTTGTLSGVTDYFCVTNSGGPTYFLPAKTHAEIQAFLSAVGNLVGISVENPGPGNP